MTQNNQELNVSPNGTVLVVEPGHYQLPVFKVEPGIGLVPVTMEIDEEEKVAVLDIAFVRGDKSGEEVVVPREGITIECLLNMMIVDLAHKQTLVPSRESAIALTKLEEAQMWLMKRRLDRQVRNVEGTYQK